jgi:hypothetical protein
MNNLFYLFIWLFSLFLVQIQFQGMNFIGISSWHVVMMKLSSLLVQQIIKSTIEQIAIIFY